MCCKNFCERYLICINRVAQHHQNSSSNLRVNNSVIKLPSLIVHYPPLGIKNAGLETRHCKPESWLYFFRILLSGAGSVYYESITHIGMEVLQRTILGALRLERLGAHLLVAAAIATVGCAQAAPFRAIHRKMG